MRLLPSKRAHLYVLERARIVVRDGRVESIDAADERTRGFNIPIANTSFLLLGPGSSITQEAVRLLRGEGVCIGFCGAGGTPLLSAEDPYPDLLTPFDEYREPRFLHQWIEIWRDEAKRLAVAKHLFLARLERIEQGWINLDFGVAIPAPPSGQALKSLVRSIETSSSVTELLGHEENYTKKLYKSMSEQFRLGDFTRQTRAGLPITDPNTLLDQGNYLAYGLASVVLWCLGIPPALAVFHGKTRRGALVFDLADVIKDGIILPMAFASAHRAIQGEELSRKIFRDRCVQAFDDAKALDTLFATFIEAIDTCS